MLQSLQKIGAAPKPISYVAYCHTVISKRFSYSRDDRAIILEKAIRKLSENLST